MTPTDRVNYFTTAFAKANPPPEPGQLPIKPDSVMATEGNRWPCFGGPMDGLGIAKRIALKKGAGKKKLHFSFVVSNTIDVHNEEGSVKGFYEFNGSEYVWNNELAEVTREPDVWNNEYWEEQRKEVVNEES